MDTEMNGKDRARSRSRSPVRRSRSKSDSPVRRRRPINIISNRVYVRNIPYDVKWQELKDVFREEVGGITYAELDLDGTGRSKGTAMIEFQNKDAAKKAVEKMHRFKLKDRKLIVIEEREGDRVKNQLNLPNDMPSQHMDLGPVSMSMPNYISQAEMSKYESLLTKLNIDGPVSHTVFVSNLDYRVDTLKVREVFQLAGNIISAEVIMDNNGRSRGSSLIQFDSPVGAIQAIAMFNEQELYNRKMKVKMDKESALQVAPSGPRLPAGLKGIGQSLQALGVNVPQAAPAPVPPVGGLDLASISGLGGLPSMSGYGASSSAYGGGGGYAASSLASSLAMGGLGGSLQNSMIGGSGIDNNMTLSNLLTMANEQMNRGDHRDARRSVGDRGGRNDDSTVFVKNLPYSLSWQDLKEKFRDNGFDVRYVELKMENGKSSGTGTVRFSSPEEARKVIDKMNKTTIEGRNLIVKAL